MKTVKLKSDKALAFHEARSLANKEAIKYIKDPMILSWLSRKTGQHSPDVDCCQEDGKESWEIYAESRGGKLRIEVDDQFVFIFREGIM
jgi:hypothetical protein